MNQEMQLVWNSNAAELGSRPQVDFMYTPSHGLTDIDFHSISAREWAAMKSPADNAVARLNVTKETTVEQLKDAIAQITGKGAYKTVVVGVGI